MSDAVSRASMLINAGRPADAVTMLAAHLASQPGDVEALLVLGQAQLDADTFSNARDTAMQAMAAAPDDFRSHLLAGQACLALLNGHYAVEHFESAIRLEPQSLQAHVALAAALYSSDRLAEALEQVDRAIEMNPLVAESHGLRGDILNGLKRRREARQAYATALRLDPSAAGTHNNIAVMELRRGRLSEATSALDRALRSDPQLAEARSNVLVIPRLIARRARVLGFVAFVVALVAALAVDAAPSLRWLVAPSITVLLAAALTRVLWPLRAMPGGMRRHAWGAVRRDGSLLVSMGLAAAMFAGALTVLWVPGVLGAFAGISAPGGVFFLILLVRVLLWLTSRTRSDG